MTNAGQISSSRDVVERVRFRLDQGDVSARAGFLMGLVVDEAHIGLDKNTEFGKFAKWLSADYLVMATATPKDNLMDAFLHHAGLGARAAFSVSRDQVVQARLNKKYIEAVVYNLGDNMAHVADLNRTVLYQSWQRNQKIAQQLAQAGVNLTPLLLVQVANGDKTVEEAEEIEEERLTKAYDYGYSAGYSDGWQDAERDYDVIDVEE